MIVINNIIIIIIIILLLFYLFISFNIYIFNYFRSLYLLLFCYLFHLFFIDSFM